MLDFVDDFSRDASEDNELLDEEAYPDACVWESDALSLFELESLRIHVDVLVAMLDTAVEPESSVFKIVSWASNCSWSCSVEKVGSCSDGEEVDVIWFEPASRKRGIGIHRKQNPADIYLLLLEKIIIQMVPEFSQRALIYKSHKLVLLLIFVLWPNKICIFS